MKRFFLMMMAALGLVQNPAFAEYGPHSIGGPIGAVNPTYGAGASAYAYGQGGGYGGASVRIRQVRTTSVYRFNAQAGYGGNCRPRGCYGGFRGCGGGYMACGGGAYQGGFGGGGCGGGCGNKALLYGLAGGAIGFGIGALIGSCFGGRGSC